MSMITKEMSVMESEDYGPREKGVSENRGTKIDYVLGDEKAIYLVRNPFLITLRKKQRIFI